MNAFRNGVRLTIGSATMVAAIGAAGCQNLNNTENGAILGSLLGAGTGAIVGHQSGHRDEGALIGAAAGLLGGGLMGKAQDNAEQRDAAVRYAQHTEMARRADMVAVTNQDVIAMTQQGFSDEHIINTMRHRGGRFDTSPAAQGYMKQMGVSERVLGAMMGVRVPR
jgi:uncharacterized protein YcfJ